MLGRAAIRAAHRHIHFDFNGIDFFCLTANDNFHGKSGVANKMHELMPLEDDMLRRYAWSFNYVQLVTV